MEVEVHSMARVLLLSLAVSGCMIGDLFRPASCWFVYGAQLLSPPPAQYAVWWHEVGACTGREKPFSSVSYFAADSIVHLDTAEKANGLWQPQGNIIIIESDLHLEPTVKHEMVHASVGQRGHDSPFFTECLDERAAP